MSTSTFGDFSDQIDEITKKHAVSQLARCIMVLEYWRRRWNNTLYPLPRDW